MREFIGVKIALLSGDRVVSILRDDIPGIHFPGQWDLPGGAREGQETPDECVLREVKEELGLELSADNIVWRRQFPSMKRPELTAWFMVARISRHDISRIRFGDEGQRWKLMPVAEFLADPKGIGPLQDRLRTYFTKKA